MAYPPGLELHGSSWRVNKRVPKKLLQHYAPHTILRFNTGCAGKREAASIAWRWLSEVQEEFARVEKTGSKLRTTLTDAEADAIIARMVHSSLEADESLLLDGRYSDDLGNKQRVDNLEESESAARQILARGIATGITAQAAADWLGAYDLPSDSPEFRRFLHRFAKAVADVNKAKRLRLGGDWVETPPVPMDEPGDSPETRSEPRTLNGGRALSDLISEFMQHQDTTRPMFKKYRNALGLLSDVLGSREYTLLKQKDIEDFLTLLCRLPPRWSDIKRIRGLTIAAIAEQTWPSVISKNTYEDGYLGAIQPFLEWAQRVYGDQGFPLSLTTHKVRYSGSRAGADNTQRAMRPDELRRLLDGPEAREFASRPSKVHCYWLPLVGLYTGARVNEVCQLNPQCDIREEEGVWVFEFTGNTETHDKVRKRVKNQVSSRWVPVHSHLIELGFLEYVKRQREKGGSLLFPQWSPSAGKASANAEKWFRRHLVNLGLRDDTPGAKVSGFHAFRHTFETRAEALGIHQEAAWLVGHAVPGESSVQRKYRASRKPLALLVQAMEKMEFGLRQA